MTQEIIDTHLHLWDINHLSYPWLKDVPNLNRNFLLPDLHDATKDVSIEKFVFVQCEVDPSQYLEEVKWVEKQANLEARIQGIVAWAPLEKGDKCRDALAELSGHHLLRGIRRIIQFEEDPAFCLQPDFIRGIQMLPEYNLTFDICINHLQIKNAIKMVAQCPNTTFILDHIAKPDIKNRNIADWKLNIKTLSLFQNVTCKMSGLVSEANPDDWTNKDLRPYIRTVLDCFGTDRILFGGDWPVSTLASSYKRWHDTLQEELHYLSKSELNKIFKLNAEKIYRLN